MSAKVIPFPESAAQYAWRRYAELVREIRARPMLAEDPEHYEKRRQAYRRFCAAFTEDAQ
jgi:hypothetical protein